MHASSPHNPSFLPQAIIRAHLFGVKALENWAMGAFAVILESHAVGLPKDLLQLTKECKEFMW